MQGWRLHNFIFCRETPEGGSAKVGDTAVTASEDGTLKHNGEVGVEVSGSSEHDRERGKAITVLTQGDKIISDSPYTDNLRDSSGGGTSGGGYAHAFSVSPNGKMIHIARWTAVLSTLLVCISKTPP